MKKLLLSCAYAEFFIVIMVHLNNILLQLFHLLRGESRCILLFFNDLFINPILSCSLFQFLLKLIVGEFNVLSVVRQMIGYLVACCEVIPHCLYYFDQLLLTSLAEVLCL